MFELMKLSLSVHNSYLNGCHTMLDLSSLIDMAEEKAYNIEELEKIFKKRKKESEFVAKNCKILIEVE